MKEKTPDYESAHLIKLFDTFLFRKELKFLLHMVSGRPQYMQLVHINRNSPFLRMLSSK